MAMEDVYQRLKESLEGAGIPYMITGSIASTIYGRPRSTQDIDIIVAPTGDQLKAFLKSLDPNEYYVSAEAAEDALNRKTMFNVLDFKSGWKFDFIICKARAFSLEEFDRRVQIDFSGVKLYAATPEDIVLAKLEWALESEPERQVQDAASILQARRDALDWNYMEKWVAKLGLEPEWQKAKGIADSLPPVSGFNIP